MFAKFQRRNNRKARLASWFAEERDGDMQAFDLHPTAAGIGAWLAAVLRTRGVRRPARGEDKTPGGLPD